MGLLSLFIRLVALFFCSWPSAACGEPWAAVSMQRAVSSLLCVPSRRVLKETRALLLQTSAHGPRDRGNACVRSDLIAHVRHWCTYVIHSFAICLHLCFTFTSGGTHGVPVQKLFLILLSLARLILSRTFWALDPHQNVCKATEHIMCPIPLTES